MATVRETLTDALLEINVIAANEVMTATMAQTALRYFQRQLDSWLAERATLAVQKVVQFTLTSGTSDVTVGPGGDVDTVRPVYLDTVNYVIPGSNPAIEVSVGIMTAEVFAALTIKDLPSALPLQCFYQTSVDSVVGTLSVYPQVTQNVDLVLYFPSGVGIPTTLNDILLAPPGYSEAFHYQLADRLITPFVVSDPMVIRKVEQKAEESYARMKRPNMQPGQLGVDAALVTANGGAYNVLSDQYSGVWGAVMSGPLLKQELTFSGNSSDLNKAAYFPDSLCGQYVEFTVYVEFNDTSAAGGVTLETAFSVDDLRTYTGTWAAIGSAISWADDTTQKSASVTGVFDMLRLRISTAITSGSVRAYVVAASHAG